ncbi:alanine:cation symporter family protein [Corynebacterium atypicum]|uniref:alanine:cation symporter family protein n=1 Tax=Corynebacterium atypicum TaxID=191610 RepID=UPI001EED5E68
MSSTVELDNITEVAVAVSVGGPGSALWIGAFDILGMSVKMAEATPSWGMPHLPPSWHRDRRAVPGAD